MRRVAPRLGLVDRSNARSSHVGEVARGGGFGLLLGAGAGLLAYDPGVAPASAAAGLVLGVVLLAVVGLADDRWGLSPWLRLAVQLAAAALAVRTTGGLERLPLPAPLDLELGPAAGVAAVVWIVAVINFYNFLDGIDGLAGLQAVVTGAALALAAWEPLAAALGACLAAAALGFLVHNWAPARIFLGDVGSGTLGFCFAAAPLLAPPAVRAPAVFLVALSLFLFLADASWTLAVRLRRGERPHQAHREHLYQRLVAGGWSHARVSALLGLAALVLTGLGLAGWWRREPSWSWAGLALAAFAFAAELALARHVGVGPTVERRTIQGAGA